MRKINLIERQRFTLETWPDSQQYIGKEGVLLIDPESDFVGAQGIDPLALDSSYMVPVKKDDKLPENSTQYIKISEEEYEALGGDEKLQKEALSDYEGNIFIPIKKMVLTSMLPLEITLSGDINWMKRLGVRARNRDSRMFEAVSSLNKKTVVIWDWNAPNFSENDVANALADDINNVMCDGEDYTLYDEKLHLVGYAYTTE